MEFVGLQTQIWRNNTLSVLLMVMFPVLLLALLWVILFFMMQDREDFSISLLNGYWITALPFVVGAVFIWFLIASLIHNKAIHAATGAQPLERREHPRVYNLLENLCISRGMTMPKLYILDDMSLNAYASGIDEASFSIAVSKGMLERLTDEELEGVLAHELTHILNRDVRLIVISIIFTGIFSFLAHLMLRRRVSTRDNDSGKKFFLIAIAVLIGWMISVLLQLAISRKREYMADAGAVQLTKNGPALASALQKVSEDPAIEAVTRDDVAQLFFHHPKLEEGPGIMQALFGGLYSTHPPIEERIELLKQW